MQEITFNDGLINGYVKNYSVTSELIQAIRYENGIMIDSNY